MFFFVGIGGHFAFEAEIMAFIVAIEKKHMNLIGPIYG